MGAGGCGRTGALRCDSEGRIAGGQAGGRGSLGAPWTAWAWGPGARRGGPRGHPKQCAGFQGTLAPRPRAVLLAERPGAGSGGAELTPRGRGAPEMGFGAGCGLACGACEGVGCTRRPHVPPPPCHTHGSGLHDVTGPGQQSRGVARSCPVSPGLEDSLRGWSSVLTAPAEGPPLHLLGETEAEGRWQSMPAPAGHPSALRAPWDDAAAPRELLREAPGCVCPECGAGTAGAWREGRGAPCAHVPGTGPLGLLQPRGTRGRATRGPYPHSSPRGRCWPRLGPHPCVPLIPAPDTCPPYPLPRLPQPPAQALPHAACPRPRRPGSP